MRKNLKGTWRAVFFDFFCVVFLVCAFRWAIAEPFLVPSGSMIPTLLIKDYIVVSKFSYGLRVPFTKMWLFGPIQPKRGDVVVFKSKDDNFYFMVKRVVGLPGDKLKIDGDNQRLIINGQAVAMTELPALKSEEDEDEKYSLYTENLLGREHLVQYSANRIQAEDGEIEVPPGHIFLMGDNRDRSADSRVWGPLPLENLLGKAQLIWMSCEEDSPAGGVLCFGEDLRQERLGKSIK